MIVQKPANLKGLMSVTIKAKLHNRERKNDVSAVIYSRLKRLSNIILRLHFICKCKQDTAGSDLYTGFYHLISLWMSKSDEDRLSFISFDVCKTEYSLLKLDLA